LTYNFNDEAKKVFSLQSKKKNNCKGVKKIIDKGNLQRPMTT